MSVQGIFVRRSFIDTETCGRIRRGMDAGIQEPAEIIGGSEGRRATIVEVSDDTLAAIDGILESARDLVEQQFGAMAEREGPGLVRYQTGDFYGPHRDAGTSNEWPGLERRAISMVLFLSSCGNGTLRLAVAGGPLEITPEPGLLVAFPSNVVHEVLPVTDGVRDVVVDWFYGPTGDSPWTDQR